MYEGMELYFVAIIPCTYVCFANTCVYVFMFDEYMFVRILNV
jgi:hypothetical protein